MWISPAHYKSGDRGIYHKFNSASKLLQIKRVNEVILNHLDQVTSYDLVEFNPLRDKDRKTEQIAVNILGIIIVLLKI